MSCGSISEKIDPQIFVIGSLNMDFVVRTPVLPREGETVLGHSFYRFPGGKGANQATGIARLGGYVSHIGKVGTDDNGEILLRSLGQAGVHLDGILRETSVPTGIAFILLADNGANRIIVIPGSNMCLHPSDLDSLVSRCRPDDFIILQNEIPMTTNLKAVQMGRGCGARTIYNPAPYLKGSEKIGPWADYIVCNEIELGALTGIDTENRPGVVKAAQSLLDQWETKTIITTQGSIGSTVSCRQFTEFVPAIHVAVADTTGAGDAFVAGLAFSLTRSENLLDGVRFATEVAAYSVTIMGAQPSFPTWEQVNQFRRDGYKSLLNNLSQNEGGYYD